MKCQLLFAVVVLFMLALQPAMIYGLEGSIAADARRAHVARAHHEGGERLHDNHSYQHNHKQHRLLDEQKQHHAHHRRFQKNSMEIAGDSRLLLSYPHHTEMVRQSRAATVLSDIGNAPSQPSQVESSAKKTAEVDATTKAEVKPKETGVENAGGTISTATTNTGRRNKPNTNTNNNNNNNNNKENGDSLNQHRHNRKWNPRNSSAGASEQGMDSAEQKFQQRTNNRQNNKDNKKDNNNNNNNNNKDNNGGMPNRRRQSFKAANSKTTNKNGSASDAATVEGGSHVKPSVARQTAGGASATNGTKIQPTCRYVKGPWSQCDAKTNLRTRTLTLRKPSPGCLSTRTTQRKCKKACRYEKGKWSACLNGEMMRLDQLITADVGTKATAAVSSTQQVCEATRLIKKKCGKQQGRKRERKNKDKASRQTLPPVVLT